MNFNHLRTFFVISLLAASAGYVHAQAPAGRRGAAAQQPAANQTFATGEQIQIQASDGTWINGTVQAVDQASGKYQVMLANNMSGLAAGSSLRRAPAGNPQSQAQQPQAPPVQPAAPAVQAAPPAVCTGQAMCMEVRDLAAQIADFRLSTTGGYQVIDATVHFVNKTAGALGIGYVSGSGGVIDDKGNRYTVNNEGTIRGIGIIRGNAPDAKFILQPGDSGDTQFQFIFARGQSILGTAYEVDLTVRELNAAGGSQYTLGAEYPLRFMGAGPTAMAPPPAVTTQMAAPAASVAPAGFASAAATPAAATGAQGGKRNALAGLSSMVPGFSARPAGASGSAGTGSIRSQLANAGSAFAGNAAPASGAPGATGTTSAANGFAALIPGLTASPGSTTTSGVVSSASSLIPGLAPVATAAPAVAAAPGDPCAGQPHCFNAGPFVVEVTQVVGIGGGKGYTLRAQASFRNVSAQPITLGYVSGSASAADNAGNRFGPALAGPADQSVSGMGLSNAAAGARFVLNPGQTRAVGIALVRPATSTASLGTSFNLSLQVSELSVNGTQATAVRQHAVSVANVACTCAAAPAAAAATPANAGNPAANALRNALKK